MVQMGVAAYETDLLNDILLALVAIPNTPLSPMESRGYCWGCCRWFKTDNVTFTVGSEYAPKKLAPRTFNSFSDAAREVGWSRYISFIGFEV